MKRLCLAVIFVIVFANVSFAKLNVSTSIFILSTIVKQIGKDRVNVSYVIPSSANPHLFSPRPRDLINFKNADLFLGVGYGFEFWFKRISYLRSGKTNIFLSDWYKNPIDEANVGSVELANPHIWLDLDFMKKIGIPNIAEALCRLDRVDCDFFKKNALSMENELGKVIDGYKEFAKRAKDFCVVDVKPAFEYLFRSIGKPTCGVVIKRGNEMPTVGDVRDTIEHCRCKRGIVVYIDNPQTAKSIAEVLNYKIVRLNPLGDPEDTKEDTYIRLLNYNLSLLNKALK